MTRQFLIAGAAFALCASAGATALAQTTPAPAPKAKSETTTQTIVRTEDGVTHETRIVREASGKVTITRDGKIQVIDPEKIAGEARLMAQNAVYRTGFGHGDTAEHLRNMLQLKPNQESALQTYVAAMHPERHELSKADDPMAPRTTPERLALMQKHLEEHTAMMRAQLDATRRFYDQLDPGQKKAFDELHMSASMGPMHLVSFGHPPMPPMPPMTPMTPHTPAPPPPHL